MNHSPGPFRAEGGAIKAVSHCRWYTVARVDRGKFTPEGRIENAVFLAHAGTHYEELLTALKTLTTTARTFRNVPVKDQGWTPLDDESLEAAFDAISKAEGKEE